ncbi:MAG: DNA primase [Clostridia bacterium]|nr:DNA primase [Clostridia bacterium]
MNIPESFLNELKQRTDIEDVISSYVALKRCGSKLVGLCPFHNEKTPSFTVFTKTQSFYCFGCGTGGDAIGFIKRIENLDFIDAVKFLAKRTGLQIPEKELNDSFGSEYETLYEINKETADYYHSYMLSKEGKKGLDYLISRGLEKSTINKFNLGFAPDCRNSLLFHLLDKGFWIGDMVAAGVVRNTQKGYCDTFRKRLTIPITDLSGKVIAFGGRTIDGTMPKYINTAETRIYKKSGGLFALNIAKNSCKKSIILCEGYMDAISMHQAGFDNAVAGCGTALSNEQVELLKRYSREVILVYDCDDAGQKALNRAIGKFRAANINIKVPFLYGGKDPEEIIRNLGKEQFAQMLYTAPDDIGYAISHLYQKYNLSTIQGKLDLISEAAVILSAASSIERNLYISQISGNLDVDRESLKAQFDLLL